MPHSRNHRYRSHTVAAKLQKNLGPPTSTLHVANLPEGHNHADIKVILHLKHRPRLGFILWRKYFQELFIEKGFTVKESVECGGNSTMALLNMPSAEEALMALAVMHNYAPEDLKVRRPAFTFKLNQLEKLEAAKAAGLVCLSLLGLTGRHWALLGLTGPYWALLGLT